MDFVDWFHHATLRRWSSQEEIFTTCQGLELSLVGESVGGVRQEPPESPSRVPHCQHIWCCEEKAGQPVIRGPVPRTTSFTVIHLGIKQGILQALLADATAVIG